MKFSDYPILNEHNRFEETLYFLESFCKNRLVSAFFDEVSEPMRYENEKLWTGDKQIEHKHALTSTSISKLIRQYPYSFHASMAKFENPNAIHDLKQDNSEIEAQLRGLDVVLDIDNKFPNYKDGLKHVYCVAAQIERRINTLPFAHFYVESGSGVHVRVPQEAISREVIEKYSWFQIARTVQLWILKPLKMHEKINIEAPSELTKTHTCPFTVYRKPNKRVFITRPFLYDKGKRFYSSEPSELWLNYAPEITLEMFEQMFKEVGAQIGQQHKPVRFETKIVKRFDNRAFFQSIKPCFHNALTLPIDHARRRTITFIVLWLRSFGFNMEEITTICKIRNGEMLEVPARLKGLEIKPFGKLMIKSVLDTTIKSALEAPAKVTIPKCEKIKDVGGAYLQKLSFGDVGLCSGC